MLRLGLIGQCLKHSKSKEMYEKILECDFEYDYLEYSTHDEIPALKELLINYDGLSITSPYKKYIYEKAKCDLNIDTLKAVNSLKLKNGKVQGTNTDYLACQDILKEYKEMKVSSVLIVGDGDMSRVVKKVLQEKGIEYEVTSRKVDSMSRLKNKRDFFDLIINCCSRDFNLSKYNFSDDVYVWDLNYKQIYETKITDKLGSRYRNGEKLLYLQAEYSCRYWEISEPF